VALLTGTVPGRLYSPDKEGEDIARKLSPVVRKEIATARAKAKADELRAAFVAALEKDGALPKTIADTEVKTTEPFTRAKPASMPELQAVLDEIDTAHAAPGTVLDPVKGRTSFMVVQVVSRTRPAADTLDEEQKEQLASQIRNIKASLAIVSFRRDLAARSEAVLFGEPVED
jgi:hypothetical protein